MERALVIGGIWLLSGLPLLFIYAAVGAAYGSWAKKHPYARSLQDMIVERLYNAIHDRTRLRPILLIAISPICTPLGILEYWWWFLWYWRGRVVRAIAGGG